MIRVEGLTVAYGGHTVVDGVDFSVDRGGALALLGVSGSGKSSTALAVAGLCGGEVRGRILIDGRALEPAMRGRTVGFVFQEPALALDPVFRIGAQLDEVARLHGRPPRLAERMADVGLDPALLDRFPNELSGGQRQRAAIAIALGGDPPVLIADEPTSALDSVAQAGILELLDRLRLERGLTLLLVTHDRAVAARIAATQRWMAAGRFVDAPPPPSWPTAAPLPPRPGSLEARGLAVDVPAGWFRRHPILAPLDLEVPRGQILGVVGASGSGKTTLGRALVGLSPHAGEVRLDGQRVTDRRRIQLVHQDPATALDPRFTLAASLREAGGDPTALLADVGVTAPITTLPARLSGGQKQRVAIARALATRPEVLVLDEALSALDPDTAARVLALLIELRARHGLTLLLISHDLSVVGRIAERVVVLDRGRIVEDGPVDAVLGDPRATATRALVAAATSIGDRRATPSL